MDIICSQVDWTIVQLPPPKLSIPLNLPYLRKVSDTRWVCELGGLVRSTLGFHAGSRGFESRSGRGYFQTIRLYKYLYITIAAASMFLGCLVALKIAQQQPGKCK